MLNETLIAQYAQHTVFLQRVGASFGLDVIPYLENIDSGVLAAFSRFEGKRLTVNRQRIIQETIQELTRDQLQSYINELKVNHRAVGTEEGVFAANTLNALDVEDDFQASKPSAAQVNAVALASPIKLSERVFTSYTSMMRSYWEKYTAEIDGIVMAGFVNGGTIDQVGQGIYSQLRLTTNDTSKNTLTRAKRSAKMLAITGTNHYANQARIAFVDTNEDILQGYRFIAVLDSRTSQQCRALDQRVIPKDSPKLSNLTPPLHPNCRSALVYEVDDRFKLDDEDTKRASAFNIKGKRDPKPVSSDGIYYDKMKQLSARDQDVILGPTLGKAFRKLDNPEQFARLTIDSLGNPLTIAEMRNRDNALSRILNNL